VLNGIFSGMAAFLSDYQEREPRHQGRHRIKGGYARITPDEWAEYDRAMNEWHNCAGRGVRDETAKRRTVMFVIYMPKTLKVGDSVNCHINGEPRRVTWCDEDTLVIEPNDVRTIIGREIEAEGDCFRFLCGDQGKGGADYGIDQFDDCFIVSGRPR
jgi:hypothetical protein